MKKNLLLILILFSVVTCRKDNVFNEHGLYGEGSAKLNGVAWTGKAGVFFTDVFCAPDSCIAISLFHYNESDALRGKITLNHVPLQTGRQTLNYRWPVTKDVLCAFSYSEYTADGDVGTGYYAVFEQNDDNYLDITKLDLSTGLISGTFQATVVRDSFWTFPGYQPDTIRITEGSFSGKIFER